jgi:hypothetical protein
MNTINIICVKWGDKYGAEYVNRLYAAVQRHTTVEHRFHCFTDNATDLNSNIIVHDLPHTNLEGWWHKVYLFDKNINIPAGEKIVFFDLDTLITGNIDQLLNLDSSGLITVRDLLTGVISSLPASSKNMQSCIMIWRHSNLNHVWDQFANNVEKSIASVRPHGDQRWIQAQVEDRLYIQDLLPGHLVSFKVHCRSGLPKNTRVVCFHGRPSIPESVTFNGKIWKFDVTPQPWVLEHWRD